MSRLRRFGIVILFSVFLAAATLPLVIQDPARSQTPDIQTTGPDLLAMRRMLPTGPVPATAPDVSVLPTDRLARRKIEAAEDYVTAKKWPEVVRILQPLLDTIEDVLIPDPRQKDEATKGTRWVSLRGEADRLLGNLPADGREYYQHEHGPRAASLLNTARETGDERLLADIVQRYAHTKAGAEALDLLATGHLDRGRPHEAAACYQWLLRQPLGKLEDRVLLRAWLALHLSGNTTQADQTWKRLAAQAPKGVLVGSTVVGLDALRREGQRVAFAGGQRVDWPLLRGDAQRTGQGQGGMALLQARWRANLAGSVGSQAWLETDGPFFEGTAAGSLPAFHPLAIGDRVVCRGHDGVHAFDVATGRSLWKAASPLSLDAILNDPTFNKTVSFKEWVRLHGNARELIVQNSVLGTLSSDGNRVYAVEDLPLPPPALFAPLPAEAQPNGPVPPRGMGPLKGYFHHNKLRALDLTSGRIAWEIGGQGGKGLVNDAYFLGPPLPAGGLLYSVVEKQGDVRLVCLHPNTGLPLWSQLLAVSREQMLQNPERRGQAASPALCDGVLVCPTNTGALVAVDLLSRRLAWAHPYQRINNATLDVGDQNPMPIPVPRGASWQTATPVIHAGKVIYTPPDSDLIVCVNLRDGAPLWQAHRADDLYLGCIHKNSVLLVGRNSCRALRLSDGHEIWQLPTGMPSGLGVATGATYYLPLRKGAVAAIDMDSGQLLATNPSPLGEVPGNLLFHQGDLISQTSTALATYPQLAAKLAQLDKELALHPNDVALLLERATLRLNQGQAQNAIPDVRAVLKEQPTPTQCIQARRVLYEALASQLQGRESKSERASIIKEIAQEWLTLANGYDSASAEHFVRLFGHLSPIGQEARFQIAEWWLDGKGEGSGLAVELQLLRLRDQHEDRRLAARATDALARLYTRKGLLEDALECYRSLGREFAKTPVRDGQTGGDLFREVAADKRFVTGLDDSGRSWSGGLVKTEVITPGKPPRLARFIPIVPVGGETPSCFKLWLLGIDLGGGTELGRLVLLDRATGAELWSHADPACAYLRNVIGNGPRDLTLTCRARGHLVVTGIGTTTFGLDLLNHRLLWKRDFLGNRDSQELVYDLQGTPADLNFGWIGPMSPDCVCLQLDSGLYGIDPFSGDVIWSRSDVGPNAEGFGDDDHLYLAEVIPHRTLNRPQRGNRRIRLRDGHIETLEKNFLDAYQHNPGHPLMGRRILSANGNDLALFDASLGRNVWKKTFPEGRVWVGMESTDPSLIGVLEAGQSVLILDPADGKELLRAKLNAKDFQNAQYIWLLQDATHFYVVVAAKPNAQAQNEPFVANVTHGVHAIACGMIYAFNRTTGKVDWITPTVTKKLRDKHFTSLHLMLEPFDDLPVLLLTTARTVPQNGQPRQVPGGIVLDGPAPAQNPNQGKFTSAVVAIDKATGKLVYDEVFSKEEKRPFFHAIHGDPRTGEFEVISAERTLRFSRPPQVDAEKP
jgi:outer membrane protein assembly factor BamB/tetratricopeptide (TPR) repeat protein